MNDETANNTPPADSDRVGFCQDCGRPLTRETIRPVGAGVFCEPCLQKRVGEPPSPYGMPYNPPIPHVGGAPSPVLAGFLGVIPGVGAMYNGQYAKGMAHLVIFLVLSSLADNHGIFGLLCFGWYCYMIFDAYHTAKAKLHGLPLPNPFGLNDIGDRLGFGKNWPGSASRPATGAPPPPPAATPWTPVPPAPQPPVTPAPDWVGYVPPTAFGGAVPPAYVPPVDPIAQAAQQASWTASPYNAPYTPPYVPVEANSVPPVMPPYVTPAPSRRFPVGAIWLIGLGILFLLGINSQFHFDWQWIVPVILVGIAVMSLSRRRIWLSSTQSLSATLSCLRWPVMLIVLAVLFALQAAHLFTLGQTWPVIVIALGALMLIERSIGYATAPTPAYVPPIATPEAPRATWTDNTPKDGE